MIQNVKIQYFKNRKHVAITSLLTRKDTKFILFSCSKYKQQWSGHGRPSLLLLLLLLLVASLLLLTLACLLLDERIRTVLANVHRTFRLNPSDTADSIGSIIWSLVRHLNVDFMEIPLSGEAPQAIKARRRLNHHRLHL